MRFSNEIRFVRWVWAIIPLVLIGIIGLFSFFEFYDDDSKINVDYKFECIKLIVVLIVKSEILIPFKELYLFMYVPYH